MSENVKENSAADTKVRPLPSFKDDDKKTGGVTEEQVTMTLYYQLNKLFSGSQLFVMEYPTRGLNQLDYAYKIEDYNSSSLCKPYVIAENEFNLSDNLMDMAPIVQGMNGKKLSTVYQTAVNNYTPKLDDIKDYVIDKMELRLFLLEKITDMIGDKEYTCSRMKFCQKLYLYYLEQKVNWDQEKYDKNREANKNSTLDEYAAWLATTAWTKDKELEGLFNDAIVRGFYHEIMTILGFLDIASPAERLQNVKRNTRTSVRRSVTDSGDVLPVSLQPSDWFRALTPNYSPKDLAMDVDFLTTQYEQKSALLESLKAELLILQTQKDSDKSEEELISELKEYKDELLTDQSKYYKEFTSAQMNLMKLAFEVISKGDMVDFLKSSSATAVFDLLKDDNFKQILNILDDTVLSELVTSMFNLYNDHIEYFETYQKVIESELLIAKNQTDNHDTRVSILEERIAILTQETLKLATVLTSGIVNDDGSSTEPNSDEINSDYSPTSKFDEKNLFSQVMFTNKTYSQLQDEMSNSSVGDFSGSIGNFFFNSSTNVNVSSSSYKFEKDLMESDFQVGMSVMKVSIERGGWFDPGIFDISSSYMRIRKNMKVSKGGTASSITKNYKGDQMNGNSATEQIILPGYPMAFLVAKDIYITSSNMKSTVEEFNNFRKTTASTSTSIFGIKVSGEMTSESYMSYNKNSEESNTFTLKIPGPQIIGWFMEITPEDKAGEYVPLSGSQYFNDMIDELKKYKDKLNSLTNNESDSITVTTINKSLD
ncbi:MAG: hypothetical protein Q4F95_08545 [Oscillospiraceae bacterium]|nr:hypothetical protein [Oscillospiraceae bacterium]